MTSLTRRQAILLAGTLALIPGTAFSAADEPPTIWDVSNLFPTDAAWTAEHDAVRAALSGLAAYTGRLGESAATLKAALQAKSDLVRRSWRVSAYAELKADENLQGAAGQERRQQGAALEADVDVAAAWMNPELLALGADRIQVLLTADPGLDKFRFSLLDLLRLAPHTLDGQGEALVALTAHPLAAPLRIRNQLVLSDMPWPTVVLSSGPVRLDQQGFTAARTTPDRADRKKAFDAHFGTFKAYESSLGAALSAQVSGDIFLAKARRYPTALAAAMATDNIPETVYHTLVAETRNSLPVLHRYFEIRRRLMGVSDLAYFDLTGAATKTERKFDIATMRRTLLQAVAPLGPDYVELLDKATLSRWMHAFPQKGKAAGAYMQGSAYDVHPYLLLNLSDDYESLTTFAHEWGHAMHSLLANKAQPFETSKYAVFIGEIASTVNELLLAERLYRAAQSKQEKLFYLDRICDLMRMTYYRQAMFGEFELTMHETVEKGESFSGEKLSSIYYGLLKAYHGPTVAIDPLYGLEWASPQHFYQNFYVYQYATSFAAAAFFADRVLSGSIDQRENYLGVLRAGSSDYPVDILKRAGLDMTTPAPYRALVAKFSQTLDDMEKLLTAG